MWGSFWLAIPVPQEHVPDPVGVLNPVSCNYKTAMGQGNEIADRLAGSVTVQDMFKMENFYIERSIGGKTPTTIALQEQSVNKDFNGPWSRRRISCGNALIAVK